MEERAVLDILTEDLAEALVPSLGPGVEIGRYRKFDEDEELAGRALPIRAALVKFEGALDDCLVAFASLGEDKFLQSVGILVDRLVSPLEEMGREATASEPEIHAFMTQEDALENFEALLNERTISFKSATGEFGVIMGSGLISSACIAFDPRAVLAEETVEEDEAEPVEEAAPTPAAAPAPEADLSQFSVTDPEVAELLGITLASPQSSDRRQPGETQHPRGNTPEEEAAIAAANAAAIENWEDRLSGIEVEVSAELGSTRMRLGDATGLLPDSVLTLDEMVNDPVTVYVNGVRFATAHLVVVDDEYGIEIIEVLDRSAAEDAAPRLAA